LEKCDTKTSRGPQHFSGPPRNETDITQNKKIRQCVFVKLPKNNLQLTANRNFAEENKDARSRLRPEEAVIYSPRFASPALLLCEFQAAA
jgi:hypothetical protein